MNERIKELKHQATNFYLLQEDLDCSVKELHELVEEKFAELVAEECMNIIVQNRKYASEHKWPASELANVCLYEIDKTFGVQEDGKETVSS